MRKMLKTNHLNERPAGRTLLALTLTAVLATVGCTTNWNRSNGEPATGATSATAPSATPGTAGGTMPQPMTSSSRITTRSPEEAVAVMEATRPQIQGRYLGTVNPPNTGEARVATNATQQFDGTIRQLTINSSISNPLGPQGAVISGSGGDFTDAAAIFGSAVASGTTAPVTTAGTAVPVTAAGTNVSAPVIGTTGATTPTTAGTTATTTNAGATTPTAAALPLTSGTFAGATGAVTPTTSSSVIPGATASTSPVNVGPNGFISSSSINSGTTTTSATRGTVTTGAATGSLRLNRTTTTNSSTSSNITVTQGANGKITISNTNK